MTKLNLDLNCKSSKVNLALEVTSPIALSESDIRKQFAEHFNRSRDKLSKFNEDFVTLGSNPIGPDWMHVDSGLLSVFSGVVLNHFGHRLNFP